MKANRLKDLREDRDLKQSDIAKLLNVSRATYSNYETGKTEAPIELIIKLADFYNVSLDYIFCRDYSVNAEIDKAIKILEGIIQR